MSTMYQAQVLLGGMWVSIGEPRIFMTTAELYCATRLAALETRVVAVDGKGGAR